MMKIVFVTVDWMKYYVGEGDEEKVVPACGYNFQYMNGCYYGYSEALEGIALEQFEGVTQEAQSVEDVLVVWLAKNREGKRCVIGWYKEATLYRNPIRRLTLDSERFEMQYSIVTQAKHALLLPVEERRYVVEHITEDVHIEQATLVSSQVMAYIHHYTGDHMNLVLTQQEVDRPMTISLNYEQYFYKADEFLARDAYAKALKCFNKAIQEEPEETLGYECKGSVLLSLKMYDEALEAYQAVAVRDADNELAQYCIGLIYGLKGEYEKALPYYNTFIEARKEDIQVRAERVMLLHLLGQQQEALSCMEAIIKQAPEDTLIQEIARLIQA